MLSTAHGFRDEIRWNFMEVGRKKFNPKNCLATLGTTTEGV